MIVRTYLTKFLNFGQMWGGGGGHSDAKQTLLNQVLYSTNYNFLSV